MKQFEAARLERYLRHVTDQAGRVALLLGAQPRPVHRSHPMADRSSGCVPAHGVREVA